MSLRGILAACLIVNALQLSAAEPAAKHVVIISVDGLPAYLFDDPDVPMSTIRSLAARGARAEGMIVSNPSVTWPNHTSIVTGVRPEDHGVLFNGVLERAGLGLPVKVNPRTDKSELVRVPTLFDIARERGMTSVGINWPCTRNSGTLAIDFPDSPDTIKHSTPEFLESLDAAGLVTKTEQDAFGKRSPIARDRIWTLAACHAIRTVKPQILLLHLLNLDAVHHRYGPRTWAGYSAVAFADRCVADVLAALDDAGIREQTTVFIVSDHGFITIPKTLQPNVLLRKAGLLTVEGNDITAATAMIVPEGGIAMLYLTRPDTIAADREKVIRLFQNHEGIDVILAPDDFGTYGLPQPDAYPQMADLILVAKDGYGFSGAAAGDDVVIHSTATLGTHGFLSTNPQMNATFVAAGAGVRQGTQLGVIENIQIAPTAAKLLGLELPDATGTALDAILD